MQAFEEYISQHQGTQERLSELKKSVEEFAAQYPMPGFDDHWDNSRTYDRRSYNIITTI